MTVGSLALRMLLSLALILSGTGTAVAGVQMQWKHAEAAQAAPPADAEPCHGDHVETRTPAGNTGLASHQADGGTLQQPGADCCKGGACNCACMHPAQAALFEWRAAGPVMDQALAVRALTLAHAAPALPHLIRPPIA